MFDTNVLVSGYLWRGSARKALEKVRSGEWTLVVSTDTINELIRVLGYHRFGLTPTEIQPIIQDIAMFSDLVQVKTQVEIIKGDPTDNIFLALAIDGRADAIVSGDHHLINLKKFKGIPVVPIRNFLSL